MNGVKYMINGLILSVNRYLNNNVGFFGKIV